MNYRSLKPLVVTLALLLCADSAAGANATTAIFVQLVSDPVISSRCLTTLPDTVAAQRCRTLLFAAVNCTLAASSQSLTAFFLNFLMAPVAFDARVSAPFGVVSQWASVKSLIDVTSNGTHLAVALPLLPNAVVVDDERFLFDLSLAALLKAILRGTAGDDAAIDVGAANTPLLLTTTTGLRVVPFAPLQYVTISPMTASDTFTPLVVLQGLAGVIGLGVMFLPSAPLLVEAQFGILVTATPCWQSSVFDSATRGLRFVFPLSDATIVDAGAAAGEQLRDNIALLGVFVALHLLAALLFSAATGRSLANAWSKLRVAPSSYVAAAALLPGIVAASVRALSILGQSNVRRPSTATVAGAALALPLLGLAVCGGPVAAMALTARGKERLTRVVERPTEPALLGVPSLLSAVVPRVQWGPPRVVAPLAVPFCAVRLPCWRWCTYGIASASALAVIAAPVPAVPVTCAVQAFVFIFALIANAVALLAALPYRSRVLSALAAGNPLMLVLPLALNMRRCLTGVTTGQPSDAIENALVAFYAVLAARGVVAIVGFVVERVHVTPRVWRGMLSQMSGSRSRSEAEAGRVPLASDELARRIVAARLCAAATAAEVGDRDHHDSVSQQHRQQAQMLRDTAAAIVPLRVPRMLTARRAAHEGRLHTGDWRSRLRALSLPDTAAAAAERRGGGGTDAALLQNEDVFLAAKDDDDDDENDAEVTGDVEEQRLHLDSRLVAAFSAATRPVQREQIIARRTPSDAAAVRAASAYAAPAPVVVRRDPEALRAAIDSRAELDAPPALGSLPPPVASAATRAALEQQLRAAAAADAAKREVDAVRAAGQHRRAAAAATAVGMAALLRGEGPMPPAVQERMLQEYQLL